MKQKLLCAMWIFVLILGVTAFIEYNNTKEPWDEKPPEFYVVMEYTTEPLFKITEWYPARGKPKQINEHQYVYMNCDWNELDTVSGNIIIMDMFDPAVADLIGSTMEFELPIEK